MRQRKHISSILQGICLFVGVEIAISRAWPSWCRRARRTVRGAGLRSRSGQALPRTD